ncbi:hypothetical protein OHQ88_33385 (plasmid) [Micromonospora zamorensis]|uniref:hypothetical protein n=1 Tax=Micromonospora zamorensis TaxID=709883 RepID=UPI002E1A31D8
MDDIQAWTMLYKLQGQMPGASPDRLASSISQALQGRTLASPAAQRAVVEVTWRAGYENGSVAGHAKTVELFQNEAFNAMARLTAAKQRTGVDDPEATSMLWAVVEAATVVGRFGPHDLPGSPRSRAYSAAQDVHPDLSPIAGAAVAGWIHGQHQGSYDAPYSASRAIYARCERLVERAQIDGRPAALWFGDITAGAVAAATAAPAMQPSTGPPSVAAGFRPLSVSAAGRPSLTQPAPPATAAAAIRRTR